jgi:hypothetical protein
MRSYILTDGERTILTGPFAQLCFVARQIIEDDPDAVLKIHKARAGERKAKVVAEFTADGGRLIQSGTQQRVAWLLKSR